MSDVHEAGARAIAVQLDIGNLGSFDAFVSSVRSALATLGAKRCYMFMDEADQALGLATRAPTTQASRDASTR